MVAKEFSNRTIVPTVDATFITKRARADGGGPDTPGEK